MTAADLAGRWGRECARVAWLSSRTCAPDEPDANAWYELASAFRRSELTIGPGAIDSFTGAYRRELGELRAHQAAG